MIGDQEDMGASASGPGSREPDPQAVPAASGFDPSRIRVLADRVRDSQGAPAGGRVSVDFAALCALLVAAHDWAEVVERICEGDWWDGTTSDLIDWVTLGYVENGRGRRVYHPRWKPICDSDGSPSGARPGTGLDGAAATARAEGIAQKDSTTCTVCGGPSMVSNSVCSFECAETPNA